jgi:hypothetical protein
MARIAYNYRSCWYRGVPPRGSKLFVTTQQNSCTARAGCPQAPRWSRLEANVSGLRVVKPPRARARPAASSRPDRIHRPRGGGLDGLWGHRSPPMCVLSPEPRRRFLVVLISRPRGCRGPHRRVKPTGRGAAENLRLDLTDSRSAATGVPFAAYAARLISAADADALCPTLACEAGGTVGLLRQRATGAPFAPTAALPSSAPVAARASRRSPAWPRS